MPIPADTLVFVTGGTGRTGVYLIQALVARGYRVRAVASRSRPDQPGVEWRQMDFNQNIDFADALEGCAAVLHLGAETTNIDRMQRVNVDATAALVASAERAGVRFFCYTSSVVVYGSPRTRRVTEDTPVVTAERDVRQEYNASDGARAYARTKLLGEVSIQTGKSHVEYVIFRPTVIVNDADILNVRGWSAARRLLLSHRHTHQIHVDDFVHAILWFMERALARDLADAGVSIYNLSNDDIERKSTINLPYLPSMLDVLRSMVKYHNWQLRFPFGMLRYSPEKLYATGYRHKLGINEAQDLALRRGAPQ